MNEYRQVENYLKSLFYLRFQSRIRKWFGGKVIGFNVSAPSLIRKAAVLERIKIEIQNHELPLEIEDDMGDKSESFRLMLK
jgi:hypothetical protein